MSPFAELLAHDGVVERCTLASRFGFMAIHGGSLERGTAEIAATAAARAGASLYTVEQPDGLQWHLPSHLTDPGASPALQRFLAHVDVVVSVHGYFRREHPTRLLLGGGNRALARRMAGALAARLDGYEVVDDLDAIPREMRGVDPRNPVNLARSGGVQLELPPRVRGLVPPKPVDEALRQPAAAAVVAALADVATTGAA